MEPRQAGSGLPNHDGSLGSNPARSFGTSSVYAQGNQKRKEYHVLRVLGAGTKACVKLAKHLKTGEMVAIKSIRKPAPAHNGGRREPIQKGFQGISLAQNGGSAVLASREDPAQLASRDLDVASSPTSVPRVTSGNSGGSRGPEAPEDYAIAEKEWRTECSIMARVGNHENLPKLIDYFETTGKWYLVMEYQRGGDLLSRLLHIEHYSERHAASIMATVCNAVHYLHSHGIAHRDLKPANLLMKDESENSNLCLIDFNAGFIVQEPSIGAVNQAAALLGNHANFLVSKQSMQTVTGEVLLPRAAEVPTACSSTSKLASFQEPRSTSRRKLCLENNTLPLSTRGPSAVSPSSSSPASPPSKPLPRTNNSTPKSSLRTTPSPAKSRYRTWPGTLSRACLFRTRRDGRLRHKRWNTRGSSLSFHKAI